MRIRNEKITIRWLVHLSQISMQSQADIQRAMEHINQFIQRPLVHIVGVTEPTLVVLQSIRPRNYTSNYPQELYWYPNSICFLQCSEFAVDTYDYS
jgi:hypothetical protein